MNTGKRNSSRSGVILVAVLIFLTVLAIAVATRHRTTSAELIASYAYSRQNQALFEAESGVRTVMSRISADLAANAINLSNATVSVSYAAPTGYSFDPVRELRKTADGAYTFSVTGRTATATVVLEATVKRSGLFPASLFADEELYLSPNIDIYSYDSSTVLIPSPASNTGQADSGSNEAIVIKSGVNVSGVLLLGEDILGNAAILYPSSNFNCLGTETVDRINPDPLDITPSGSLGRAFTYYSSAANNNNAAVPQISGNKLVFKPTGKTNNTMTMPGGKYYLNEVDVANGATINIDGTPSNPVVIFLTGEMKLAPKDIVNASNRPGCLYIFSNSSAPITILPNSAFSGFVYAPAAQIQLFPNGNGAGLVWGNLVNIKPGGLYYVDTSLRNSFLGTDVQLVHWRILRD